MKDASREAFAKTVRDAHGWPDDVADDDCCSVEAIQFVIWDKAWHASRKQALTDAALRVSQCTGPRSSAEQSILGLIE